MQKLTEGHQQIPVEGSTVRQVVEALESLYPGFKDRVVENDRIRVEIAVAVDGEVAPGSRVS